MPPTATEVNARLHKAVNEKGDVKNMDAVNEMISWLEKINITLEVLEETRIGRTMNEMRTKIKDTDKELAKRVKNLIKKWKKDMEKLKSNGITNDGSNRTIMQPGNLNISRNTELVQSGTKRKQKSAESSPRPSVGSPKVSSPRLTTQRIHPPSMSNHGSPRHVSSPKLRPNVVSNVSSPKNIRNTPSPLINNINHKIATRVDGNVKVTEISGDKNKQSRTSDNQSSNGLHSTDKELKSNELQTTEIFECVSKDNDTRVQEDRISSMDSGYHGTLSCDENSPTLSSSDDKLFLPIDKDISEKDNDTIPTHFDAIEPEDLEVKRKEFDGDSSSPSAQVDGVNGTFDNGDQFCDWTNEITHDEFSILPYVILD